MTTPCNSRAGAHTLRNRLGLIASLFVFATIAGACDSDLAQVTSAKVGPHLFAGDADDPPQDYECKFYWVGFVPQDDSTVVLDTIYLEPDDPTGYNGFIYANPVNIIEESPYQKQVVNFRWHLQPPSSVYGQSYDHISWECADSVDIPVEVELIVPEDWPQNPFEITDWEGGKVLAFSLLTNSWPHDFDGMEFRLVDATEMVYAIAPIHITVAQEPPPCPDFACGAGTGGTAASGGG